MRDGERSGRSMHSLKNTGFTLIEMMVVVMILGILAVGGYPMLMGFASQARLEQAARMVYEDLCVARESACAANNGTTRVFFFRNPANPMYLWYDIVDSAGNPIVGPFGTRLPVNPSPPHPDYPLPAPPNTPPLGRNLASMSACLLLNPAPPPGTQFPIEFGPGGRLVSPVPPFFQITVRAYNASSTPPTTIDEVGEWTITIEDTDENPSGRIRLNRS